MVKNTIRLARKALNRAWFVLLLLAATYVAVSILYGLFEDASLGDGMWWAIVTATTTGYGDFFPVTIPGRIIAGLYMAVMLVLNAFLIGHIVSAVVEDKNLFSHKEQEQLEAMIVMMAKNQGLIPKDAQSYPSIEWLREQGLRVDGESE